MRRSKEVGTAVGTLALAAGIGYVMQSSELAQERYGTELETSSVAAVQGNTLLPEVKDIHLTSAQISRVQAASGMGINADHLVSRIATRLEPSDEVQRRNCHLGTMAMPKPGGMVEVQMDAPCRPNERVTVKHNGLKFSQATDDKGRLKVTVPALTERAVILFEFTNGDSAVAQAHVDDLEGLGRTALQWRGDAGLELHAREFGASYGSDGHVWSGVQVSAADAMDSQRGFLVQLGDRSVPQPFIAEVYTFPVADPQQKGTIDLTIEAEVNTHNCGMDIEAQSIELMNGSVKTQDVVLAIPGCSETGNVLVLNNLVSDIQIAENVH